MPRAKWRIKRFLESVTSARSGPIIEGQCREEQDKLSKELDERCAQATS